MAVIVANLYQQAAMCNTDKHRAPHWLSQFALVYMPRVLFMEDKVKAVLNQKVRCQRADTHSIANEKYDNENRSSSHIVVHR
jgi:hypothetical protein